MNKSLREIVPEIAKSIAMLGSGEAAQLRRGPISGAGVAVYWRMAIEYDIHIDDSIMPKFVQSVAILTPKGNIRDRSFFSAHKPSVPMGIAISNADISEKRLSRFLDTPKHLRPDSTVRICRRLAGTEHAQFNLLTLAYFLHETGNKALQEIAREYFRAQNKKSHSLDSINNE